MAGRPQPLNSSAMQLTAAATIGIETVNSIKHGVHLKPNVASTETNVPSVKSNVFTLRHLEYGGRSAPNQVMSSAINILRAPNYQ
jgi:hypothetical protein